MKILTVTDIQKLVPIIGLENFLTHVISALEEDFGRWNEFILSPRHETYYPEGVIELMPCADRRRYAFKYVTGYPRMISEMTLLTAFRTAANGIRRFFSTGISSLWFAIERLNNIFHQV